MPFTWTFASMNAFEYVFNHIRSKKYIHIRIDVSKLINQSGVFRRKRQKEKKRRRKRKKRNFYPGKNSASGIEAQLGKISTTYTVVTRWTTNFHRDYGNSCYTCIRNNITVFVHRWEKKNFTGKTSHRTRAHPQLFRYEAKHRTSFTPLHRQEDLPTSRDVPCCIVNNRE